MKFVADRNELQIQPWCEQDQFSFGPRDRRTMLAILHMALTAFEVPAAVVMLTSPLGPLVGGQAGQADLMRGPAEIMLARIMAAKDPGRVLEVNDASEALDGVAYGAAANLVARDQICVGALCLLDHEPHAALDARQRQLLLDFAGLLAALVALPEAGEISRIAETERDFSTRGCALNLPWKGSNAPAATPAADVDYGASLLFNTCPLPMYVYDIERLTFLAVNDAASRFYGRSARDMIEKATLFDILPEREHAATEHAARALGFEPDEDRVWTHRHADGGERLVSTFRTGVLHGGRPAALVTVVDQTERFRINRKLSRTQAFLDSVVESIPIAVFVKDMNDHGRYVLYNKAGEHLSGRSRDDLIGRHDGELFSSETAALYQHEDLKVMAENAMRVFEHEVIRRCDGVKRLYVTKKLPVSERPGGPTRYIVGMTEDLTERRADEARIAHMAHHDALTNLPNRVLMRQTLEASIARADRYGEQVALLYVDLDNFKGVNDSFGHSTGDALLRGVADRLRQILRKCDLPARLGGDEFAILQAPITGPHEAAGLARRVIEAMSLPFSIEDHQLIIGASIGIALSPSDATLADTLLEHADTALYRAKDDGRGVFRFFEAPMNRRVQTRRQFEAELRRAVGRGAFELRYQPIVAFRSETITGFEAVLFWPHPSRGLLPASAFRGLAAEIGLTGSIFAWMLHQGCHDAAGWPPGVRLSVKLPQALFKDVSLVTMVGSALAAAHLSPDRLEVEISEQLTLADLQANIQVLNQLRDLGLKVALDDFGAGTSSLLCLRAFPFSAIRLDKSFVRDVAISSESLTMVRAITGLGNGLGVATVAEDVDTIEAWDHLRAVGCTEAQGLMFGASLTAEAVAGLFAGAAEPLQALCSLPRSAKPDMSMRGANP